MRGFIRRVMTLSGLEVDVCLEASNGEEALERLREQSVDVILTDINMPKMNGEEFLRRLESEGLARSIPRLVISTDATKARILRMLSLGADGYMTKPFSPEALREELERVLGAKHV
jgi:two-component system chemotaxis response regulator CheY